MSIVKKTVALCAALSMGAVFACAGSAMPGQVQASTAKPAQVKAVKVAATGTSTAKVTWKKVKKAKGYQVRYSTTKAMKRFKTVTIKKAKAKSKKLTKLKGCTTYYVKVRAYKKLNGKKVYGKWSKKRAVKTAHIYKQVAGKDATCTEAGFSAYKACTKCGATVGKKTIAALDHTAAADAAVAATCTTAGKTAGIHCSVCGTVIVPQEEVAAFGHTPVTEGAKVATCTMAGSTGATTCTTCGEVLQEAEEIPALGHTYVTDGEKAATCTEDGSTGVTKCSACGDVLKEAETIPAFGHTVVSDTAVAATCTEAGITAGSHCAVCGEVLKAQEAIPAKGHTVVTDAAVAATCTTAGLTEGKHCSVCNTVLTAQEAVPAKGHTAVPDAAVAATCTATGLTAGSHCSVCNVVLKNRETTPALGHSWGTEVTQDSDTTGHVVCSRCEETHDITVPKADTHKHTYNADSIVVTAAPSCTSEGSARATCTTCGQTFTVPVAITDHDMVVRDTRTATCGRAGYTISVCRNCTFWKETDTPALSHNYVRRESALPTCTTAGHSCYMECTVCGDKAGYSTIDAYGHRGIHLNASEATLTTSGNIDCYQCMRCGGYFSDAACTQALTEDEAIIPKLAKANLEAYTWSEIKQIANVIAACNSQEEAIEMAKSFNLVGSDGKLTGNEKKAFQFTLGKKTYTAHVQILGFLHDNKADGSGKAGITFGFVEAFGAYKMNNSGCYNKGGWKATVLYNSSLPVAYLGLPQEIRDNVVKVTKMTNNSGTTDDTQSVTGTSESFWLLSTHELFNYNDTSHPTYALEGEQYQLFADNNITSIYSGSSLCKKSSFGTTVDAYSDSGASFWLRTPVPFRSSWYRYDTGGFDAVNTTNGYLYEYDETNDEKSISPCFCF